MSQEDKAAQARHFKSSLEGTLKASRGSASPIPPTRAAASPKQTAEPNIENQEESKIVQSAEASRGRRSQNRRKVNKAEGSKKVPKPVESTEQAVSTNGVSNEPDSQPVSQPVLDQSKGSTVGRFDGQFRGGRGRGRGGYRGRPFTRGHHRPMQSNN